MLGYSMIVYDIPSQYDPGLGGNVPFINPDFDPGNRKTNYFLSFSLNRFDGPLPDHYILKDQLFSLITGKGSTYYRLNRKYRLLPVMTDGPFKLDGDELTIDDHQS